MAHRELLAALGMIIVASAASAANGPTSPAPAGTPQTKYCLHVAPVTGSLAQTIQCWTREEWADEGVDVDQAWAKDGVGLVG